MAVPARIQPLPVRHSFGSPLSGLGRPQVLAPVVSLVVLTLLVVFPLVLTAIASLRPANTFPLQSGPLVLSNYVDVFADPSFLNMLRNTLVYAVSGVVLGLPLALLLAFLTERTDLPFRHAVYTLMFIPLATPSFATALGWVLLTGNRAGTLNQWLRYVLHLNTNNGPLNIFTLEGMIFVSALGVVPSMWLLLIGMVRNMDANLEEAAAACGASRLRTLLVVTIPLIAPGLLAIVVLFTIAGVESLDIPLVIGPTAGINVVPTRIRELVNLASAQGFAYGPPAVLGVFTLALGVVGIWVYLRLVRQAERYHVVTGKNYRPKRIQLGRWKLPALVLIVVFLALNALLPFSVLVVASFQKFYTAPVPGATISWTLDNYAPLLDFRFFGRAFVNTVVVSIVAATVTMLLAAFLAWQVVRWPSRLTQFVNGLAFMPLGIPAVISGLAFFLLFIGTPLFGTLALLALAFIARYIAYSTRLMHAAQIQIHRELEEAALVSRASRLTAFLVINLRLLVPPFLNGWLWVIAHASRDFTTPLMVATAGSLMAANEIYGRYEAGAFPAASAMMVAVVAFNLGVVLIGRRWLVRMIAEP